MCELRRFLQEDLLTAPLSIIPSEADCSVCYLTISQHTLEVITAFYCIFAAWQGKSDNKKTYLDGQHLDLFPTVKVPIPPHCLSAPEQGTLLPQHLLPGWPCMAAHCSAYPADLCLSDTPLPPPPLQLCGTTLC
ncbi:unnamed protein product [Pleuronectes platessa]|uniref:Uncharacterized protein n=1 Tax=Pleuronectes platessa TaxID=8262 RepID=A0A9N7UHS4_PLEPL|nr:unnamed protein product [Pleuronectes platessa]